MQVVAASQGLAIAVPQKRADSIPLRIELHEAIHVVGHQHPAIRCDLQTIRPAIIFDYQRPDAVARNPENAAEGDTKELEMPALVERRPLVEAINGLPRRWASALSEE